MLNAIEIAALRWFAAVTFPSADDCAPAAPLATSLHARGYLRRAMGSYVPSETGELELQIESVVQAHVVPGRDPVLAYAPLCSLALRTALHGGWSPQARAGHDHVMARRDALMRVA